MMNFRYPNITGASDKEQLEQMKRYLRQLVDQLNYAFSVIRTEEGTTEKVLLTEEEMAQILQELPSENEVTQSIRRYTNEQK
jgi:hypothetical protein